VANGCNAPMDQQRRFGLSRLRRALRNRPHTGHYRLDLRRNWRSGDRV